MKSYGAATVRLTRRGELVRDVVVGLLVLLALAVGL
jgi:hypothetical protein